MNLELQMKKIDGAVFFTVNIVSGGIWVKQSIYLNSITFFFSFLIVKWALRGVQSVFLECFFLFHNVYKSSRKNTIKHIVTYAKLLRCSSYCNWFLFTKICSHSLQSLCRRLGHATSQICGFWPFLVFWNSQSIFWGKNMVKIPLESSQSSLSKDDKI